MESTSAEPGRKAAYSRDIGWRVVWQKVGMGLTFREIASRLQIATGTAHHIFERFQDTGDVSPNLDADKDNQLVESWMICTRYIFWG